MQQKNTIDLLSSNESGAMETGVQKFITLGFAFLVLWYLYSYGLGGDLKL